MAKYNRDRDRLPEHKEFSSLGRSGKFLDGLIKELAKDKAKSDDDEADGVGGDDYGGGR